MSSRAGLWAVVSLTFWAVLVLVRVMTSIHVTNWPLWIALLLSGFAASSSFGYQVCKWRFYRATHSAKLPPE